MTPADPSPLAAAVAAILESEAIPYMIGGSVAASIYGEPRSTLDVDVMIDAGEDQVRRLVAWLDYFAARGQATQPLPYTSGFAGGTTYPFYVATRPFTDRSKDRGP